MENVYNFWYTYRPVQKQHCNLPVKITMQAISFSSLALLSFSSSKGGRGQGKFCKQADIIIKLYTYACTDEATIIIKTDVLYSTSKVTISLYYNVLGRSNDKTDSQLLTQLNVYLPITQTRDTEIIQQMHGRLPERPKPIYAGHPWL